MSGMDGPTDAQVLSAVRWWSGLTEYGQVLAHRRASQAAPGPSDAANSALNEARNKIAERRNACPPGQLFKAFNEAIGDIDDLRFALTPAPAPSDGLREAVETIVNTHGFLTDLGYILGKQNGNYRRAWASAVVRREMVKLAQQYADDGIQALTPAPAQEGGE